MSGFDFDALRDPDAPRPGERERAGVDARARQLRVHARRTRFAATATSIVACAAIVVGVVAVTRDNGPSVTVEGPSTSSTPTSTSTPAATSSIANRFVPPTTVNNGIVTMPVRLPDGEAFIVSYPQAMRIAELGFAGGIGVSGAEVDISYDTVAHAYLGETPIATYPRANGVSVPMLEGIRPAALNGPRPANELAFQFGPWLVRVPMNGGVTAEQRAMWARSLTGTVDPNGYLVLHAASPLVLSNEFDGGFGQFVAGHNEIELSSHLHCGQQGSDTATHRHFVNGDGLQGVSWCPDDGLHVAVSGSASFIDLAANLVVTRPIAGQPRVATSTTTTTRPATARAIPPAISASFVSPTHGWALEQSGRVTTTTNGGISWKSVGSLGSTTDGERIRFADATHGFAFDTSSIRSTTDGGAHWSVLSTPFTGAYDLAIARGVVYAIAWNQHTLRFDIWSAPASHLVWARSALTLPISAGPVPLLQLVLAGSHGWILDEDRTVIAGAQLSSTGRWVSWKPPCRNVDGPAYFAAWGPTDLIATCNEGVWGGPPLANAVYTSHDAGGTFQRHRAPAFGAVAAADPNDAVIVAGDTIRRSVDGGRTWKVVDKVTNPNAIQPLDLGFTSDSQGFAIFGTGQMLMTYDAGATWSRVALP